MRPDWSGKGTRVPVSQDLHIAEAMAVSNCRRPAPSPTGYPVALFARPCNTPGRDCRALAKKSTPMSSDAAARIQSAEAKQSGGKVEAGSFASRAQSAAAKNSNCQSGSGSDSSTGLQKRVDPRSQRNSEDLSLQSNTQLKMVRGPTGSGRSMNVLDLGKSRGSEQSAN
ncbi:hypothetical protein WJX74_001750 [Apatococcus lobatus]|uniref:SMP domain-containing protein n=1 Tax=Apatococcus lobatus TaxID=904363 RepID=A0AAW1S6V8_9CHLO